MKRTVGALWDGEDGLGGSQEFYFAHGKSEMSYTSKWRSRMMESEAQGKGQSEFRSGSWHLSCGTG